MVIDNFHIGRASCRPAEHNPPLIVDADRVKSSELSLERFEPVSGRHLKIVQGARLVHLNQLPQGDPGDIVESTISLTPEQFLGVAV